MSSETMLLVTEISTAVIAGGTLVNLVLNIASNYSITKVKTQTNSLMDKLVLEVRAASIAKTILSERQKHAKSIKK